MPFLQWHKKVLGWHCWFLQWDKKVLGWHCRFLQWHKKVLGWHCGFLQWPKKVLGWHCGFLQWPKKVLGWHCGFLQRHKKVLGWHYGLHIKCLVFNTVVSKISCLLQCATLSSCARTVIYWCHWLWEISFNQMSGSGADNGKQPRHWTQWSCAKETFFVPFRVAYQ